MIDEVQALRESPGFVRITVILCSTGHPGSASMATETKRVTRLRTAEVIAIAWYINRGRMVRTKHGVDSAGKLSRDRSRFASVETCRRGHDRAHTRLSRECGDVRPRCDFGLLLRAGTFSDGTT
jgi:hypothetical protein